MLKPTTVSKKPYIIYCGSQGKVLESGSPLITSRLPYEPSKLSPNRYELAVNPAPLANLMPNPPCMMASKEEVDDGLFFDTTKGAEGINIKKMQSICCSEPPLDCQPQAECKLGWCDYAPNRLKPRLSISLWPKWMVRLRNNKLSTLDTVLEPSRHLLSLPEKQDPVVWLTVSWKN